MALGTIYATLPAVVAAAGIYFFDRNHSKSKENGGGFRAAIDKPAKAKDEEKTTRAPKLAPQFDGLHCFETLVGR
ncbi:hypothetical protein FH972_016164 [Carpinus fangiana]|uniref:Uncharacterized protein n=1 Tax=Carpinus fangiana TaxID=176857 RepID=A0A5N6RF21_9ROSI|nr:hypothetical protein FH972_016164 [Carpinus fangiana]